MNKIKEEIQEDIEKVKKDLSAYKYQ